MQYTQQQQTVAPQFNKATNEITEFFRSHDFDRDGYLNPTEYRYFLRDSLSNGDRPSQFVLDLIDDTVSKQRSNIDLQSAVNSVMNLKAYLSAPSSSYMTPSYAPQQQSFQQMNNSVFPQSQFAPPPNYINPFMMPESMNMNPFQQQTQAPIAMQPQQMYAPMQMQAPQQVQQTQVPQQQQQQQQVQLPPAPLPQQPQQQQTRVPPQPPVVKQASQMPPQPTPIAKQAAPQPPMVKQPSTGSLPIATGPRPAAAPVQTATPARPASTVAQKPVAGQFKQPQMMKIPPRPVGNQQASPPAARQTQGTHHVSKEEKRAFVEYLNTHKVLSEDPDMKSILPIDAESNQLFDAVSNGVLFCKLLDAIKPGTIPASSIKLNPRNQFEKVENHVKAINAAKQLGCTVVNIGPEDLLQGKAHLIMGLMWQMIRIDLLAKITIQEHPEICTLVAQNGANGMSLQQITQSTPEQVLMHWVNHHLAKAGYNKPLTNFSEDIKDAAVYSVLLNQVAPDVCSLDSLHEQDVRRRAQMVVENARALGCNKFITPTDILSGNSKLNLAFVADLFNKRPGLELPSMEDLQRLKAANSSLAGVISEAEERLRQILADRDLAYRLQQEEIALYRERKAREQQQLAQEEAMLIAQQKEEELMFEQQRRLENLRLAEQEQNLKEQQKQEELRYEQQRAEERRRQQWQQIATQEGVVSEAQRRDQMVREQREIERRIQQENMMRAEQATSFQQQQQQQQRMSVGYGGAPYSVSTYTTTSTQSVATDPTFMFSGTSTYSRRPGMVVRRF